jgi:RND family efflux transporter MFP subunit
MENKKEVENRIYQYDKQKEIKVFTTKVTTETVDASRLFTGTFQPDKEVKINADVQGKIVRYYVDAGDKVRKGQPLVKLDESILNTQLQQINVQIETLEKDLARYQILAEADAIPGIKLEKVQQGIKTAKAQKQTILTQLSKTTIKAPFSGIVTMKFQEIGAFAAPGVPLVLLTDISHLKFTINVPERSLELFKKGTTHTIKSDVYPNLDLKGKVTRVGSKGNMSNSFTIEFAIKNTPDKKLKANMFGKVAVEAMAKNTKAIVIPVSATIGSEKQPQVYVVKEGKAVLTNIIVSNRFDDKIVIGGGLKDGDTIITSGFINLFDGANVITN